MSLRVYGEIACRNDSCGERMPARFSLGNRPPMPLSGPHPVIDLQAVAGILATASSRGVGSATAVPSLDPDLVSSRERGRIPSPGAYSHKETAIR